MLFLPMQAAIVSVLCFMAGIGGGSFVQGDTNFFLNHILLMTTHLTAIASFAVLNSLNNIFALTMSGVFSGERDKDSLQSLLKISLIESLLITLLTAVITCWAAPFFVSLFIVEDVKVFTAAVTALRIYIWYLPLYAISEILFASQCPENDLYVIILGKFIICLSAWINFRHGLR